MTDACSSKDVSNPFKDGEQACVLAQAVVDSVREPLLVLDSDLRVISAGRSFYTVFQVAPAEVVGRSVFDLIDGRFNVPGLQALLKGITPNHAIMARFEIEASFPGVGQRTLILNAREVFYAESGHKDILLEFEDVTERRATEREKEALLKRSEELVQEKEVLLLEMQHRVANSLQIIANILSLKALSVASEESRQHLQDAYRRVMSVASLQQHIDTAARVDLIEMAPYLSKLCDSLAASMIGDHNRISLKVISDESAVPSSQAVSLGLIVTELVINALKYAFPKASADPEVLVSYETSGPNWQLVVSDNGVGKPGANNDPVKDGLGTTLVKALAQQLEAKVETTNSPKGLKVSVTRATFKSRLPRPA